MERRRFKQTLSLNERLTDKAKSLREEAELLPVGFKRDDVLRQARECDTGSRMNAWLQSSELQPPK